LEAEETFSSFETVAVRRNIIVDRYEEPKKKELSPHSSA